MNEMFTDVYPDFDPGAATILRLQARLSYFVGGLIPRCLTQLARAISTKTG